MSTSYISSWLFESSCSSPHLRPRVFHMFYKYINDITYITESGRKKNKQARTWVSPKRKKGDVLTHFWHSVHLWLSPACTRTKFPHSYQERWLILSRRQTWILSPLVPTPHFSSRFSLTVAFPWLQSVDCSGILPFLVFFGLVGNLARNPFVWVSRQNRQRNPLTGAHPHPHSQKECPPSGHSS